MHALLLDAARKGHPGNLSAGSGWCWRVGRWVALSSLPIALAFVEAVEFTKLIFPICIPRFPVASQDSLSGKAVEILGYSLETKHGKGMRMIALSKCE